MQGKCRIYLNVDNAEPSGVLLNSCLPWVRGPPSFKASEASTTTVDGTNDAVTVPRTDVGNVPSTRVVTRLGFWGSATS